MSLKWDREKNKNKKIKWDRELFLNVWLLKFKTERNSVRNEETDTQENKGTRLVINKPSWDAKHAPMSVSSRYGLDDFLWKDWKS